MGARAAGGEATGRDDHRPRSRPQPYGGTLSEIDPENRGSPYQLHHGNEELITVTAGRPTPLRTPAGVSEPPPGDMVASPTGFALKPPDPKNCTTGPVRVLVISTMVWPDVVEVARQRQGARGERHAWCGRPVGYRIPRASSIDRLERVAVGRLAPVEVRDRPWSSAIAGVLDRLGYWR